MIYKDSEKARLNKNGEVPFITFPALSRIKNITHGFSTRLGGVSKEYFTSMNLGYTRGDDVDNVNENYNRICNSMGMNWKDLVATDQIHETVVRYVTEEDKGKGIIKERGYDGVDGLITNRVGVPLVTYYADCVPLYFVDPVHNAIGLSHSGWRGTVKSMGMKTLERMKEEFGTNPSDVIAVIGPSICQDCYEVSEDVAMEFKNIIGEDTINNVLRAKNNHKYDLNLWEANRQILLTAGVLEENINSSEVCTCCNPELLYSHRAQGSKRGSLAAFLMLKDINWDS